MEHKLKIGLFGIGLDTCWAQFDGLLEKLRSYQGMIKNRLLKMNTEVTDAGMVDNPFKAIGAAELFNRNSVDLIFLNISNYY